MSHTQPDGHAAFQAFHGWMLKNFKSTGLGGDVFLPYDLISAHLEYNDFEVLNDLLGALYQDQAVPIRAKEVVGSYSRIFCILVSIGRVHFLQHFMGSDELNDAHLPLLACPRQFPVDTSLPNLFEVFQNAQWKFCPTNIEANCNRNIDRREILPFVAKELIGTGSSADIFSIEIYPLCNHLPDDAITSTFALKTYRGLDAEKSWENEVQAFQKVLRLRPRGSPNVIGFYTAFKHGDMCHVILEYADRGSLEQYLRANIPPTNGVDVARFWTQVLGLVRGLKDLHNGHDVVWHQDIKPANILVLSNSDSGSSLYDSTFKIADLGTSHSKHITSPEDDTSDRDAPGTRIYGAPECYRADGPLGQGSRRVTAIVDVFSLGAVFSEIVIWMAGGYEYLEMYRGARRNATRQIPDFHGGDCFHDGTTMLPVIAMWHQYAITRLASTQDVFTPRLVPMIEAMLQSAPHREDAKAFCTRAHTICAIALNELRLKWPNLVIPHDMLPLSTRMSQRANPSVLPPDLDDFEKMDAGLLQGNHACAPGNTLHLQICRPVSKAQDISGSSSTSGSTCLPSYSGFQCSSYGMSPDRNHHLSIESAPPLNMQPFFDKATPGERRFSDQPSTGPPSLGGPSRPQPLLINANYRFNGPSTSRLRGPSQNTFGMLGNSHPIGRNDTDTAEPSRLYSPLHSRPSTSLPLVFPDVPQSSKPTTQGKNRSVVYMSRKEAMKWREESKNAWTPWNRNGVNIRDEWVLKFLDARDSVIIVDDSESMRKHWPDMTELVRIIAYIIKRYDEDGIDFYFASSRKKHNETKSSKIANILEERSHENSWGHTVMSDRLEQVLSKYGKKIQQGKSLLGEIRQLNVYVFTDANWTPQCDIVPTIDKMVTTLQEHDLPENQVGLQFISFGDSSECLDRLKLVDNYLVSPPSFRFDIVDTTPSDGNLYKMIRGAVDRDYDYEPGDSIKYRDNTLLDSP